MNKRPEIVTDEFLIYLDDLRESGVTNMFGSPAYLISEFGLTKKEAREVFKYWAENFKEELYKT